MEPNLPSLNNINWTAAASAVAVIFAYFFPGIPDNVRSAILLLLGIIGLFVIAVLHNIWNKPAVKEAVKDFASESVTRALKNGQSIAKVFVILFVMSLVLPALSACASFFDNPQNDFTLAQTALDSARTLYNQLCQAGTLTCSTADIAEAEDLYEAATAALTTAETALGLITSVQNGTATPASGTTDADTAITAFETAVQKYEDFVNSIQAKQSAAIRAKLLSTH